MNKVYNFVADKPDGPFIRIGKQPVLTVSNDFNAFDSYRVDDASLMVKDGKTWLYYKGRSRIHGRKGPGQTRMGVAFADKPEGPFKKYNEPLLDKSHEVLIWPHREGVAALASISATIEYAPDGLNFNDKYTLKVINHPRAPGLYRHDLSDNRKKSDELKWGISMLHNNGVCYLMRFNCKK